MEKMTKKGYIRTLEAILAILIIFVFIFSVLPQEEESVPVQPAEIRLLHQSILREIQNKQAFRDDVLNSDDSRIIVYVGDTLSLVGSYGYLVYIQDANGAVSQPGSGLPNDKNVYADSAVIGSNLNTYNPKLVTLYIWE